MGQKTNPLCFRLGTTQSHHSIWFEEPKKYSAGLQEDQKIRTFFTNFVQNRIKKYVQKLIKKYLQKINQKNIKQKNTNNRIPPPGFEGIVRIEIQKQGIKKQKTFIRIIIYSGFVPKFLFKGKRRKNFEKNVKKQEFFYVNPRKIRIELKKAKNPYRQPNLLAEFIALQLKNRVPFRKTMKQAVNLAKQTGTKGMKVQIKGRLDGKDIARVQKLRKGKLPLQRVCAKIDHCSYTVRTIYGVLGLKIWIFIL